MGDRRGKSYPNQQGINDEIDESLACLIFDNNGLVRHGRNVGPSRRTASHHDRDLRYPSGGEICLVEENAAKVLLFRKDFSLPGKIGATRVYQVNAREIILLRDFLRTQMFLQ